MTSLRERVLRILNDSGSYVSMEAVADAVILAIPSPEPLPREALDVERLARAIQRAEDGYIGYDWPDAQTHAEAIAVEYAALSPDRPTPLRARLTYGPDTHWHRDSQPDRPTPP